MTVTIAMTETIFNLVSSMQAFDDLEQHHIQETCAWIASGAPLFRLQKPDIPNTHLVSYFVLFDEDTDHLLLVDHKKACLWLPSGGHVEVNEHPMETVKRECMEELGIQADFWSPTPLFLTSTVTVGITAGHTDVSLWYVLKGDRTTSYAFDREEFHDIRWFHVDDIPYASSDPHLKRFVAKLQNLIKKH